MPLTAHLEAGCARHHATHARNTHNALVVSSFLNCSPLPWPSRETASCSLRQPPIPRPLRRRPRRAPWRPGAAQCRCVHADAGLLPSRPCAAARLWPWPCRCVTPPLVAVVRTFSPRPDAPPPSPYPTRRRHAASRGHPPASPRCMRGPVAADRCDSSASQCHALCPWRLLIPAPARVVPPVHLLGSLSSCVGYEPASRQATLATSFIHIIYMTR